MFNKMLIANRSEIALRIIRACRELGISTVAVYSETDDLSLHKKFADEAICIGPADPAKSYLNIPAIISAAELTNVDAIHPGYGFLAESPEFAQICKDNNITFIGPSHEAINTMGNKSVAKKTMKDLGVPIIPGSDGNVLSVEEGIKISNEIGYPVIIKASFGGGGRGMRFVKEESQAGLVWKDTKLWMNPDSIETIYKRLMQEKGPNWFPFKEKKGIYRTKCLIV